MLHMVLFVVGLVGSATGVVLGFVCSCGMPTGTPAGVLGLLPIS